ncbi:MAG: cellulase family glycosylhydrolase [Clostridia bacterium]|nr:cellulase family glycosylhydrolase [Clostridia bacterium]
MKDIVRGVNIGNWLVLERWMDPDFYEDNKTAHCETDFMLQFGDKAIPKLTQHRDTFITKEDFEWIKNAGLNSVRIPVPHWIFGDFEPNLGCIKYLDNAIDWANELGLKVLIDMHCAPGSQNGEHHSGLCGIMEWHKDPAKIQRTIDVMGKLTERYKDEKCLWGMQLLNEPDPNLPKDILRDYYTRGYHEIRKHVDENVTVAFHDQFDMHQWVDFMQTPEYKNVTIDVHIYHCFGDNGKNFTFQQHLDDQLDPWLATFKKMQKYFKVIIGEWSLGLNGEGAAMAGQNWVQRDAIRRAFAGVQLQNYETTDGYFFWSYKTPSKGHADAWSYRAAVENNYFPKVLK